MEENTIYTLKTYFHFGKHNGQSLFSVIKKDTDYIIWCLLNIDDFMIDKESIEALISNQTNINKKYISIEHVLGNDDETELSLLKNKLKNVIKTNQIKTMNNRKNSSFPF